MHRAFTRWADQLGPIYRFRFMWISFIGLSDPALATEVMHRTDLLDKNANALRKVDLLLSPGGHSKSLITRTTNDEMFKTVRKGIAPAFAPMQIKRGFGHVVDGGERLVSLLKRIGSEAVVDINQALLCHSLDVIGQVGFDRDMKGLEAFGGATKGHSSILLVAQGLEELDKQFRGVLRQLLIWRPGVKEGKRDVREGKRRMANFQAMVMDLLKDVQKRPPPEHTIAAHLLRIRDPNTGLPLDERTLQAEIGLLFIAGFETSGNASSWLIFQVSQHPDVAAKIRQELADLGLLATPEQPQPRQLEWADLAKLQYLNCCIKESMRMFPVVGTGTTRVNPKKDVLLGNGKLYVPRGTIVWIGQHALMNCQANWSDPDKFIPERWAQAGAEYADGKASFSGAEAADELDDMGSLLHRRPKKYWPFSEGPRTCVGQSLGKMNVMATAAILFSHFTFSLAEEMGGSEGVLRSEKVASTTRPGNGIKVHAMPFLE
eukprot:jgi/Astpho2/1568/Aster-x1016